MRLTSDTRRLSAGQHGRMATVAARPRAVAAWLFACAVLVYAVLIVGGITRLTHSGLSIVVWQPLVGALPPMSAHDWTDLFERYRASPEFLQLNTGMTLAGFKAIFWWEYAHRLMGRLAGLALLLPWLWLTLTRRIDRRLAARIGAVFVLGALQGLLGWTMVASGLVDDPHVSPLLLAAHLGLALLIIGSLLWTGGNLLWERAGGQPVPWPARATTALVFAMALTGALVAGNQAGHIYNTFPRMGTYWVPPELWRLHPWYLNFLHNPGAIQFLHRCIAWSLLIALPALAWWMRRSRASPEAVRRSRWMLAALALQFTLGVSTLLSGVLLPLAAAHQAGAVLLFAATLWNAHGLGIAAQRPRAA